MRAFQGSAEATATATTAAAQAEWTHAVAAQEGAPHGAGQLKTSGSVGSLLVACLAVGVFGWAMPRTDFAAGSHHGYGEGYRTAQDAKAAAAWTNTSEGQ